MAKKRVFISFDYEHDNDIKGCLVAQAKDPYSPFSIVDMSIKEAQKSNWKDYARKQIRGCDCVIVLCGEHTSEAKGVAAEVTIAREEGIPYFLLRGRRKKSVKIPSTAKKEDVIHSWTWKELRKIFQEEI